MESKYSVYNLTRGSLLGVGVTAVDTTLAPLPILKKRIESVARNADAGVWLAPFRGIPADRGRSCFDVVYLDKDLRVIQGIGLFNTVEFERIEGHAASVLALPSHSISRTQTCSGDQLIILAAEETERRLRHVFDSGIPVPLGQDAAASVEDTPCPSGLCSSPEENGCQTPQASMRPLDQDSLATSNPPLLDLKSRFLKWLRPNRDRRQAHRHPLPGLVAYYWTGGTPRPQMIGDISADGFYLLTEERWTIGTVIQMTLQRTETAGDTDHAISVLSRVVRSGTDGVGFEFEPSGDGLSKRNSNRQQIRTERGTVEELLSALNLIPPEKRK
jgi:PilZ domain